MNKKWILAGMAALTAMSVLTGCGTQSKEAAAKTDKPLIVGTEPSFPPFEMAETIHIPASISTWPMRLVKSWDAK